MQGAVIGRRTGREVPPNSGQLVFAGGEGRIRSCTPMRQCWQEQDTEEQPELRRSLRSPEKRKFQQKFHAKKPPRIIEAAFSHAELSFHAFDEIDGGLQNAFVVVVGDGL